MSEPTPGADDGHGPLPDGTRLVVRGGTPSPDELAALVAALDASRPAADAAADAATPPWQRAARLEGLGLGPVATPVDLDRR